MGADIIVNTEGDNQYKQEKIPELIKPILDGRADLVISDRQTQTINHFSKLHKFYQKFGTWVLNKAAGTDVPDAISGFRAYTRQAAMQLNPVRIIHGRLKLLCKQPISISPLLLSLWPPTQNSGNQDNLNL